MNVNPLFSIVRIGIIRSDDTSSGMIRFVLEENYNNEYPDENIKSAIMVGKPSGIKINGRGLFIQEMAESTTYYFIGMIDIYSNILEDNKEEGVVSKNKKSKLTVNDNLISLRTGLKTESTLSDDEYKVFIKNAKFMMASGAFVLGAARDQLLFASVVGGERALELRHENKIDIYTKDVTLRLGKSGNVIITGERDSNVSSGNKESEKYKSIGTFYTKARNIYFDADGGSFMYTGNVMKVNLGSSKMADFIPGTGPTNAYEINITQGDVDFSLGLGNFEVKLNNFSFTNYAEFQVGTMLHPTKSNFYMDAYKMSMKLDTVPFVINSELTFKTGGFVDLKSFSNITMSTKTGKFSIEALQDITLSSKTMKMSLTSMMDMSLKSQIGKMNIEALQDISLKSSTKNITLKATMDFKSSSLNAMIEAKVKAVLKAMMINIEAKTKAEIKAMMIDVVAQAKLDFSKSAMINFGPKVAAPTGSGPLCAIPMCIFSGVPHVGGQCV